MTSKENFIEVQIANGGDPDVIKFIADARFKFGDKGQDMIRRFFMEGYCYYFAYMLKKAFNRGKLYYVNHKHHIVWYDTDIAYDIEGVFETDNVVLVPIKKVGDEVLAYKHVPGQPSIIPENEVEKMELEFDEIYGAKKQ